LPKRRVGARTHAAVFDNGEDFTAEAAGVGWVLGTHAAVSDFCFVEKAKPLPFTASSAFSAVQSAVSDNGEDFTAEGAEELPSFF